MSGNDVEVEYCVPCGLLAAEETGHLLPACGRWVSGLRFAPGRGGVFRGRVGGEVVFDKAFGEGFDRDALVKRVSARLAPATAIRLQRP